MRNIVGVIVYRIVQILLLPFAAVGYIMFVTRLIAYSRRTGAAATVLASLYTRYMQHMLGTRPDTPAARLMLAMPNVSQPGLLLTTAPTLVAHRLTGYVPKIYRYPYPGLPPMMYQSAARTTFYDQALERHLADIDQLVILGAGFDTRAYRLSPEARARCFEIDEPKTQAFKRAMLQQAGIDTSRVTFVPADFAQEDWFEKLVAVGFAPDKRSFFTWESVTMYLDVSQSCSQIRNMPSMYWSSWTRLWPRSPGSPTVRVRHFRRCAKGSATAGASQLCCSGVWEAPHGALAQ
jgi:leucine carboxyl methyltransferase